MFTTQKEIAIVVMQLFSTFSIYWFFYTVKSLTNHYPAFKMKEGKNYVCISLLFKFKFKFLTHTPISNNAQTKFRIQSLNKYQLKFVYVILFLVLLFRESWQNLYDII